MRQSSIAAASSIQPLKRRARASPSVRTPTGAMGPMLSSIVAVAVCGRRFMRACSVDAPSGTTRSRPKTFPPAPEPLRAAGRGRSTFMRPDPSTETRAGPRVAALLERERELAVFAARLADARTGEARPVVMEGPAGIGKTRLLDEARAAAAGIGLRRAARARRRAGARFRFRGRAPAARATPGGRGPDERAELFAGAAGLAEAVIAPPSAGAAPAGDLARGAPRPLLAAAQPLGAGAAARRRRRPAVGRRAVAALPAPPGAAPGGLPVAMVATRRRVRRAPSRSCWTVWCSRRRCCDRRRCRAPRSPRSCGRRLGEDAAPDLCDACHESARGNPFLLGELLLELEGDDRPRADPRRSTRPPSARSGRPGSRRPCCCGWAGSGRTARLARAPRCSARRPATAGGRAGGAGAGEAGALADALTELGVLSPGGPCGSRTRSCAAPSTRTSRRRAGALHRRAAELLGADPEHAAVHLLATDPAGDRQTVAALARPPARRWRAAPPTAPSRTCGGRSPSRPSPRPEPSCCSTSP